jgi:hypothetical protein
MKMDHIEVDSTVSFIRLYQFNHQDITNFLNILKRLATSQTNIVLNKELKIKSVNCQLVLATDANDTGIISQGNGKFICRLTPESYHKIFGLVEKCSALHGNYFQWLYDVNDKIGLLFSTDGSW